MGQGHASLFATRCSTYRQTMDVATWVGVGTLATAVIGLSLVVWQLREQRRAMRAEFGNLYIQRYWQIDDDLLLAEKGTPLHDQHRHRYLRLFEDEFDVSALGFLDTHQWASWHAVLDEPAALATVRRDLEECSPSDTSFKRLRACIDQREKEKRAHPAAACAGCLSE